MSDEADFPVVFVSNFFHIYVTLDSDLKAPVRLHLGDNHAPESDLCHFFGGSALTSVRACGWWPRFSEFETIYHVLAFQGYFFSGCIWPCCSAMESCING